MWDKLTDGEKDYVRQRDREICIEETTPTFENFKGNSSIMFGASSLYPRERSFTSKLNDSSNNTSEERLIRIWKNTPDYIIFYIEETIGTSLTKQFIKVTATENAAMISALQNAYCDSLIEYSGSTGGPVTAAEVISINLSSGGRRETRFTYTYLFTEIAYWENYRKAVTLTEFDINNAQTTSKAFTSALTENPTPPLLPTDYTTLSTALCHVDPASYVLPYTLKCDVDYSADMAP